MVAPQRKVVTYAEYMALAELSDVKLEYVDGEVVAMSGGTIEHGRLISRITTLLGNALNGRRCIALPSDVRVRIRAAARATYPDVFVVCDDIRRDDEDRFAVINPTVIVEVLSRSTESSDRGDKFAAYRRLASLREYVMVSQLERRVDVHRRDGRRWQLEEHFTGERVGFAAIDVELAVDDIYVDALGAIIS
jgi:Uma2 family endonuclease